MSYSKEDIKREISKEDLFKILDAKRNEYYDLMQASKTNPEFEKYQTLYWAVLIKISRAKEVYNRSKYVRTINTSMEEYNIPTNLMSNQSNLR